MDLIWWIVVVLIALALFFKFGFTKLILSMVSYDDYKNTDTFESHVHPHSELTALIPDRLWWIRGTQKCNPLPRNMYIYKFIDKTADDTDSKTTTTTTADSTQSSGSSSSSSSSSSSGSSNSGSKKKYSLLLYSVVAVKEETLKEITDLGEVAIIFVPNRFHRLDALVYKNRFPNAQVICPEVALEHVAQKVPVDQTIEEYVTTHPENGIEILYPDKLGTSEVILKVDVRSPKAQIIHPQSHALLSCDYLFNMTHEEGGPFAKFVGSSGFFGITRIGRFLMTDPAATSSFIKHLANTPHLHAVCVGHGNPIFSSPVECRTKLLQALETIRPWWKPFTPQASRNC